MLATRAGTVIGYGYDATGRRRTWTLNGVVTQVLWSGEQEVAEYDAAGVLLRRFVRGSLGPDEMLAVIGVVGSLSARRRFHHADGLGSVVAVTNNLAAVVEKHAYTPYGVGDVNTGTPWRFTGRRLDAETGLYHLRARDYAPLLGRFIQPDPIGIEGGINLYAYVGNNPLNRTDPSGLFWPLLAGGIVGAAAEYGAQRAMGEPISPGAIALAGLAGLASAGFFTATRTLSIGGRVAANAYVNAQLGAAQSLGEFVGTNAAPGTFPTDDGIPQLYFSPQRMGVDAAGAVLGGLLGPLSERRLGRAGDYGAQQLLALAQREVDARLSPNFVVSAPLLDGSLLGAGPTRQVSSAGSTVVGAQIYIGAGALQKK